MFSVYRAEEETGDEQDINRVVCQLLNRSIATRTITKQEAMCELGGLDLVLCSDFIETVSLSGAVKLRMEGELQSSTFLSTYCNRNEFPEMSLHQYYHHTRKQRTRKIPGKNDNIPHYVGGSSQPKYPITPSYARSVLLIHRPWSNTNAMPEEDVFLQEFEAFVQTEQCPLSVKIAFERAKKREEDRRMGRQETISEDREDSAPTDDLDDEDVDDTIALAATLGDTMDIFDYIGGEQMDLGLNYNWVRRFFLVRTVVDLLALATPELIKDMSNRMLRDLHGIADCVKYSLATNSYAISVCLQIA